MLSKLKSLFGGLKIKSRCFSSCCNDIETDVNIDLDNDGVKDINIHLENGEIEVKLVPPKSPTLSDHMKVMGL